MVGCSQSENPVSLMSSTNLSLTLAEASVVMASDDVVVVNGQCFRFQHNLTSMEFAPWTPLGGIAPSST
jgi:hypothetical protein